MSTKPLPFPGVQDDETTERDGLEAFGEMLAEGWSVVKGNFNKALRVVASLGLTSTAALNTYDFLSRYNDPRTSAAAAISFEVMYIAAAWRLRLPRWCRWLSSDAAVIISGLLCSTVYNVFAHIIREMGEGAFSHEWWQVGLSVIMSLLLTIPACLLLLSVHGNNDVQLKTLSEDKVLDLLAELDEQRRRADENQRRWEEAREILTAIKAKLDI